MTFSCYIESNILTVPHMEPLEAESVDDAKSEAERLLYAHSSGYAAPVFREDQRLLTIRHPAPWQDRRR